MGHYNRHYAGDRHALHGAWSPPNSAANFCEEDYDISYYVAEFINSLTNLAYVFLALRFMYGPGSRGLFAPKYDFMSISLLVLGICSFLFHASMRQALQFADELAMLGLVWSFLHGTLAVGNSPTKTRFINTGLAIFFPLFAAFYVWNGQIIYHAMVFLALCILTVLRCFYLFWFLKPGFPEAKRVEWRAQGWKALFSALLGYLLWHIDLEYCAQLRELRGQIGLPWAWLLEFHGWWHILTAIGASMLMDIIRELQAE
ncbi:ceramidase, partial [Lasiosphaeria hispida]